MMSVLAATGAGAAVGWVCGLVPVWPVARVMAAAFIGSVVGSVTVVVLMLLTLSRSGRGGLGAVSLGLSEAVLLGGPAVVLVAVVGSVVLRRMGWSPARVATYGPIIFGAGAALIAASWFARGMGIASLN